LGVEHLIATEPEVEGSEFTGRVAGIPCFKEGKIARLDEWLDGQGMTLSGVTESWFYSDSFNDLPLLSMVTHPVAVDPDPTLRVHAEGHDWPVTSLR
jgi:phosphoserine phosphatase